MIKEEVISLLLAAREPVSGEQICKQLGVTRAAVWKAIDQLRQEGYTIEAAPRRGYTLTARPDRLDAALIGSLSEMEQALFTGKTDWLREFAAHCITIGQDVKLVRGDEVQLAHADGIDEKAGLLVTYQDGSHGVVSSGEVSVRGMYGYT